MCFVLHWVFELRVHILVVSIVQICQISALVLIASGVFGEGEKESPLVSSARSISFKFTELRL